MKRCPNCGEEYPDTVRFCMSDGYDFAAASAEVPTEIVPSVHESPPDPLVGRVLAGRYRLMKKLGRGGMGTVYKGEHIKMGRSTAVKILAPELARDSDFVRRFEREAAMAARIDHPNAVGIYDFGEAEDGIVYLAMQLLEGEPLSGIIKRKGALPLDRTVRIARQAADALQAAHRLGIIHRDFKPDNVMICRKQDQADWVSVLDFGIAKETEVDDEKQALTKTGFVLGTPQYMSPEQVKGEPLDPRSDQYSLAIVCYEMLTGALPFGGDSPQSQMVRRLLEPPLPMRRVRPQLSLPVAVEQVIMRGLALRPDQRFSTAVDFVGALEKEARSQSFYQPQPLPPQPLPPQSARMWERPPETPGQARPANPHTPHTPQSVTPVVSTPQAFQPPRPFQPAPAAWQHQQPPAGPTYYGQPPSKSKAGPIIIIIVLVVTALMGSCVLVAISNMN
jgi:serine/threonine-protein kinase